MTTRALRALAVGLGLAFFVGLVAHYAPAQSAPAFSNTASQGAVTTRVCSDAANVGSLYTQIANGGLSFVCLQTGSTATLGTGAFQWLPLVTYIGTENGSNNAIASPAGTGGPLTAGLVVTQVLSHTLQAGADTYAYNGAATAAAIKSHRNTANNIGTGYSSGGIIQMIYDGTQWEDLSQ